MNRLKEVALETKKNYENKQIIKLRRILKKDKEEKEMQKLINKKEKEKMKFNDKIEEDNFRKYFGKNKYRS